jgi:hypothetical protein
MLSIQWLNCCTREHSPVTTFLRFMHPKSVDRDVV